MLEEEALEFYLADKVPFDLKVEMVEDFYTSFAVAKSSIFNKYIVQVRSGNPKFQWVGDKLTDTFQNSPLRWSIEVKDEYYDAYGPRHVPFTEFFISCSNYVGIASLLKTVLGKDITLQVEICDENKSMWRFAPFRTKEMEMLEGRNKPFEDKTFNPNLKLMVASARQSDNKTFSGYISVIVVARNFITLLPEPSEQERTAPYKKLLENYLFTDAAIVCSNGTEVKCHRSILSGYSDVFEAMFEGDYQEAKSHIIKMSDMNEDGVRAFLAYLYHWDDSKAQESSVVALELLQAGHKYNIIILENGMRNILISKPQEWFDIEMAMKLFFFIYNFDEEWESLKKKSVKILKKNFPDLSRSDKVKRLFKENPDAAMVFCQYAITRDGNG